MQLESQYEPSLRYGNLRRRDWTHLISMFKLALTSSTEASEAF